MLFTDCLTTSFLPSVDYYPGVDDIPVPIGAIFWYSLLVFKVNVYLAKALAVTTSPL